MAKTFILRWNPEISSYTLNMFKKDYSKTVYDNRFEFPVEMNWSIYDHKSLSKGDEFFMFTTGDDDASRLVMHGFFSSGIYRDENWNTKSYRSSICYADMDVDFAVCPDCEYAIRVSSIRDRVGTYDLGHGHAGVVLDEGVSEVLRSIVCEYRDKYYQIFSKKPTYTPYSYCPTLTLPLKDGFLFLEDASRRLVEGFHDNVLVCDRDKVWDCFLTLCSDAFSKTGKLDIEIEVVNYWNISRYSVNGLDEVLSIISPLKEILVNDCRVSLTVRDSRWRSVSIDFRKIILINYGRKYLVRRLLKSMGFENRPDTDPWVLKVPEEPEFGYDDYLALRRSVLGEQS